MQLPDNLKIEKSKTTQHDIDRNVMKWGYQQTPLKSLSDVHLLKIKSCLKRSERTIPENQRRNWNGYPSIYWYKVIDTELEKRKLFCNTVFGKLTGEKKFVREFSNKRTIK